jgi:tetratricopeptide (TPR) repeat protein
MRGVSILLTVLIALPSMAGAAEDKPATERPEAEQKAREHYIQGEAAFKAGRYDEAITAFEAGFAIVPRPKFLLNIAHTERKLGQLLKARSAYKKYLLMEPDSRFRDSVMAVIDELNSALADDDRAGTAVEAAHPAAPSPMPPSAPRATQAAVPMVAVASAVPASDPASSRPAPVYRRTWFWVAVGAVLVGAGGGIYLSQRSAGDGFQASGSLGSLRP